MPIYFDFYPTPNPKSEEETVFHPRVITTDTAESQEIEQYIQNATSLTISDVRGALAALSQYIATQLLQSRRVHLQGIGYFQVVLDAPPTTNPKSMRTQRVHVKGVRYRADSELNQQLEEATLERNKTLAIHSSVVSDEEMDARLTAFFATHPFMTTRHFRSLFPFSPTTSYRRLHRLIEEGKLQNINTPRQPLYKPTPGHYGSV
jgi:predicted histone-like DNA-binding protein